MDKGGCWFSEGPGWLVGLVCLVGIVGLIWATIIEKAMEWMEGLSGNE